MLYQLFYPPSNCDTVCTIIVFKNKICMIMIGKRNIFKKILLIHVHVCNIFPQIPICRTEKIKLMMYTYSISTNIVIVDRLKYFCMESYLRTHVYIIVIFSSDQTCLSVRLQSRCQTQIVYVFHVE